MKTKASEVSLRSLAAETYEKCNGDAGRARSSLSRRLLKEREFLAGIVGEIAHEAIRNHMRSLRATYFPGSQVPKPEPVSAKEAEIEAAQERLRGWYEMPLSTGKHLGSAVKDDLNYEADMHHAHAEGNRIKTLFYRAISERIPDADSTVSSVLSEDDIEEIARDQS